jgi:hypothetical protein
MKTTVDIADDLFEQIQKVAQKEKRTFRSLMEQGLRSVLKEKGSEKWKWKPVVAENAGELSDAFKGASWEQLRDEIYFEASVRRVRLGQ